MTGIAAREATAKLTELGLRTRTTAVTSPEPTGSVVDQAPRAGVHHTDCAQGKQRYGLHGVAQPGGIVEIVRRERPNQCFMQCSQQGRGRKLGVLRRQMSVGGPV